jgi:hypothetical protein
MQETQITVIDGADGLTPDMLRGPNRRNLPAPDKGEIVMSAIPTPFRGSAMESHDTWPRTWTAPDATKAGIVLEQVERYIGRSGFAEDFDIRIDHLTITVNRRR